MEAPVLFYLFFFIGGVDQTTEILKMSSERNYKYTC